MKKPKKALSYADTPESAITHWWGTHADRVATDDSTQLLMSLSAMGSISDLMSDNETSVLPTFMSMRAHEFRSRVSPQTLSNAFTAMFERRGLEMPTRVGVQRITADGSGRKSSTIAYACGEVCELLWDSVAQYIDCKVVSSLSTSAKKALLPESVFYKRCGKLKQGGWPSSEEVFSRTAKALVSVMPVQAVGQLAPGSIDTVMEVICNETFMATGLDVDRELLSDHISQVCMQLEPTPFLAKTLLRAQVMQEVLGDAVAQRVRSYCFRSEWRIDVPSVTTDESFHQAVMQELHEARKALHDVRLHLASGHTQRAIDASGVPCVVTAEEGVQSKITTNKGAHTQRCVHDAAVASIMANSALTHIGTLFNIVEDRSGIHLSSSSAIEKQIKSYALILNDAVEMFVADTVAKVGICVLC